MFQTKTMCIVDKSYKTWTSQEYTIMKGVFDEKKMLGIPGLMPLTINGVVISYDFLSR